MSKLTVLVFMAADNDLGADSFALKDLHELEKRGSDENVSFIVQLDRAGAAPGGTTLRGRIQQNPAWSANNVETISALDDIGETNTGNPDVLRDFIVWGMENFPADGYALIIWAHGTGWRSDQIEAAVGAVAGPQVELAARSVGFGSMYQRHTRGLMFRRTLESAVESFVRQRLLPQLDFDGLPRVDPVRIESSLLLNSFPSSLRDSFQQNYASQPIENAFREALVATTITTLKQPELQDLFARAVAMDSTDMSALDSIELRSAILDAYALLDSKGIQDSRFKLIAFDACLMACFETAFQLRDCAAFIVASQEEEPRTGWRYDLSAVSLEQAITPPASFEAIASRLVDDYLIAQELYIIRLVTGSAVRTASLDTLAKQMDVLGATLVPMIDTHTRHIQRAEKTGTRFRGDKDFLDIGHFLSILKKELKDSQAVDAIDAALLAYEDVIVSSRFAFAKPFEQPSGLSVYFPAMPRYDRAYDSLEVSAAFSKWIGFIKEYHLLM